MACLTLLSRISPHVRVIFVAAIALSHIQALSWCNESWHCAHDLSSPCPRHYSLVLGISHHVLRWLRCCSSTKPRLNPLLVWQQAMALRPWLARLPHCIRHCTIVPSLGGGDCITPHAITTMGCTSSHVVKPHVRVLAKLALAPYSRLKPCIDALMCGFA